MRKRSNAIASDAVAEQAAEDLLLGGASALGAVIGGFFAVSGCHTGVLLGPVTVLVAGIGVGARAFDGRICQPGLGTKRPRGFINGDVVPRAASIGIATGVMAALVANAHDGATSLGSLLRPAIAQAQRMGATERAELLRRIRAVGAGALQEASYVRPLQRAAAPSEGGLLTAQDLAHVPEVAHPARERTVGDEQRVDAPWSDDLGEEADESPEVLGVGGAILAVDGRGVFAALAYRRVTDGISIDGLELEAPAAAVPVRRGIVRVRPGARLPAPAPIALFRDEAGRVIEARATPTGRTLDAGPVTLRLSRNPLSGDVVASRG